MCGHPDLLTLGFIRTTSSLCVGWGSLHHPQPLPPGQRFPQETQACLESGARMLLVDRVIDAHGIQVLTDRHLDRAHDLTDWEITELTPPGSWSAPATCPPGMPTRWTTPPTT